MAQSLLPSALKQTIAKAFKGRLLTGTLRREAVASVNSHGDPVVGTITSFTFEGIRESFSARYKAQSGIPADDVSILVLQGSLKPATTITMDDQGAFIFMGTPWNKWHKIRVVLEIDPAGATARLQCFEVAAPA